LSQAPVRDSRLSLLDANKDAYPSPPAFLFFSEEAMVPDRRNGYPHPAWCWWILTLIALLVVTRATDGPWAGRCMLPWRPARASRSTSTRLSP